MIFFIINILITNKESMNWILQKKKKRKRIFEKFKHRENHQLRYQTSIKFISRRRLTISSVTKTFHNSPTCKRRGGRIRGIFDATGGNSSDKPSSSLLVRPEQFACFIGGVFRPGKKPAGHYIPGGGTVLCVSAA